MPRNYVQKATLDGVTWKVGQDIYVPTSMYLSRGVDDVCGGKAKITHLELADHDYVWVTTKEHPGHHYSMKALLEQQKKLKKEFGKERAYPDPDDSYESNHDDPGEWK